MTELGNTMNSLSGAGATLWTDLKTGAIDLANTAIKPLIKLFNELANYINGTSTEDILTRGMTDVTDTVDDNGRLIRKNAIASIPEISVTGSASKVKKRTGGSRSGGSTKNVPTLEEFWLQMTKNDMKLQDQKAAGDLVKDMPSPYQMMFDEIKKQYLDKKDFDYGKDISKEWKVDSKGNLTNKPETRVQESMARDLSKFTGYAEKTLGGVSNIVGGLSQLGVEIPKG